MKFDTSWYSLVHPEGREDYFDLKNRPSFQATTCGFSLANAWWMAELSRLIYQDLDKSKKADILATVELQEVAHLEVNATCCFLVESIDTRIDKYSVLVFRGSSELENWISNLDFRLSECSQGGRVHEGFMLALNDVWTHLEKHLINLKCSLYITGHSLGGSLATLAASRMISKPQGVYTFGSPRVGDKEFAQSMKGINIHRVVNNLDIVTTMPPSFKMMNYCHVGELHHLKKSKEIDISLSHEPGEGDLKRISRILLNSSSYHRLSDPPEYLADHAPVNYVAQIEMERDSSDDYIRNNRKG